MERPRFYTGVTRVYFGHGFLFRGGGGGLRANTSHLWGRRAAGPMGVRLSRVWLSFKILLQERPRGVRSV